MHSKTSAVIDECGGVLAIQQEQWPRARELLLKSFKGYDEAVSENRYRVLCYYVLVCILTGSHVNPFDSQDTQAYRDHEQIGQLAQVVDGFFAYSPERFRTALHSYLQSVSDSTLIFLLNKLVSFFDYQALANLVRPYSRASYEFLGTKLGIDTASVPLIMLKLILDGQVPDARLDDVDQVVLSAAQPFPLTKSGQNLVPLPQRYGQQHKLVAQEREEKLILNDRDQMRKYAGPADINDLLTGLAQTTRRLHSTLVP